MRTGLSLAILATVTLAMLVFYAGSEAYYRLVFDGARTVLENRLRLEMTRVGDGFLAQQNTLLRSILTNATMTRSLAARQSASIAQGLRDISQQLPTSSRDVRLSRIYVVDEKSNVVAAFVANRGVTANVPCAGLIGKLREGLNQPQQLYRICLTDKQPYYVALVSLKPASQDYLYVAGEMAPALNAMAREFSASLRLHNGDGVVVYRSAEWPSPDDMPRWATGSQQMFILGSKAGTFQLDVAKDMSTFHDQLTNARYWVLLGMALSTVGAMFLVLMLFERSVFKPLRTLATQLQRLSQTDGESFTPIAATGVAEVDGLAGGFTSLSTRMREMQETLQTVAFTDALTGLPNRSLFLDRLQQSILAANRDAKPFAMLLMDLDRFKDINDTLGHQVGDQLLSQVAQRLRAKLRASDTVARMGGDEFAVLLPAVDSKHAAMASRMLLQALRLPFAVDEHNLTVSASIGIALYPENGVDTSVLLQRADVAMYAAKSSASGFSFYNAAQDQNYPTRLTLMSDLRNAVEQEQFELYYQPIVNLVTNRVCGLEALARWRHPREGVLLPDSFIPLMEQSGLIHGFMPWVVSEALKRARSMQSSGSPLTISINLSMRDLMDPYVAESFAEQLEANQVAAGSIVLEITESAVMTDTPRTLELLSKLSGMGLKIAIDDFGTGYSSLTYLKKLPVNTIKIDKSFVIGMVTDENDAAIVRTSIDLAHNLGLKVVAEGVESEGVLNRLKSLHCDLAQGHFIGRPLTQTELDEWLLRSTWGMPAADNTPESRQARS